MANVDFPDIYIDASAGNGGDGSFLTPYNAFSQIEWSTITTYYSGTPTASVVIHFKRDGVWREFNNMAADGTATYPIYLTDYGTGELPMFLGSIDVSGDGATYQWTQSSNWTSDYKEYFLELFGGGVTGLLQPYQVHIDDVRCSTYNVVLEAPEAIGTLSDHGYAWGDGGGGFNTIVIRDESGDPDSTGVVIEASNRTANWVFYLDHSHYVAENLDVRHSGGHGFRIVGGNENVWIQDCVTKYNFWAGVQVYSSTDCGIRRNDLSHSCGSNININGSSTSKVLNLIIEDNNVHDADVNYGAYHEASGMKAFCLDYSVIRRNRWYNNLSGGFRLDGLDNEFGCDFNEIYENEFYNNGGIDDGLYAQMELEFSSDNLIYFNYFHDPWGGGPNLCLSHSFTDRNYVFANIFTGSYTNYWQGSVTNQTNAGDTEGDENHFYNNLVLGAVRGFHIGTGPYTVLRNNIVAESLGADISISNPDFVSTIDSDYNFFTGEGPNKVARVLYTNYNLEEWQDLTANASNPCDVHSSSADPMLTDPDNEDFSLQTGSPCIGTAENLGAPFNIGLLAGSTWPDGVLSGNRS